MNNNGKVENEMKESRHKFEEGGGGGSMHQNIELWFGIPLIISVIM